MHAGAQLRVIPPLRNAVGLPIYAETHIYEDWRPPTKLPRVRDCFAVVFCKLAASAPLLGSPGLVVFHMVVHGMMLQTTLPRDHAAA